MTAPTDRAWPPGERPPERVEIAAVAAMALVYRELAYRRYSGLESLWDEFRETGEVALPLSSVALLLICELRPADFGAIATMERVNMNPDPEAVAELRAVEPLCLEPALHALDRDPRDALATADWAARALARWTEIEEMMQFYRDAGATRTIADCKLDPEQQAEVDRLHRDIAGLLGELYVD